MFNMRYFILFLIPLFLLGACSSPNYLSTPEDFKYQVEGLTLKALLKSEDVILGEIIEVDSETITILRINQKSYEKSKKIQIVSKKEIVHADVIIAGTSNNPKAISTRAGIINAAPLAHGYFAIITVPLNLAITLPIANNAAKASYRVNYPENISWDKMTKFARFPQGIPENIDPRDIE